ncbi:peptide chain release factor 3 [Oligoflexaceae bacterium]|nr:peptide chain release factor 3 [Oligoflexaceae bacterium]
MSIISKEIEKRRTFAIISHPDAGKTTITEKLLLYGGAIQMAGMVKAKRSKKFATSDWMELEKQRGISVTSSVMKFPYKNHEINLIDTPGHQDFSEDTYRTLTAVDSALMLLDVASGVEAQTIKLFEVCRLQKMPIMAYINKLDREGKDPFELMDEIEKVLGIRCYPMTWPIGMGSRFRGVYDRVRGEILIYDKDSDKSRPMKIKEFDLNHPDVEKEIGDELAAQLREEVELLEMAGNTFSIEDYLEGKVAPCFFGSALNNFGVERLLDAICEIAPPPRPRKAISRQVQPDEEKFSAFIFKIQANMDPSHRDRVAFMRICSGKFERGMKATVVRTQKAQRLGRPTQFMAQDRSLVDEAFAGDIVGIHDPGVFKMGDTLTEGEKLVFTGIPVFAPEHFVRVDLKDPIKSKQLGKALDQLSEEGAVQVFRPVVSNVQILGVVGILQFDVVKYRIENEYGVKVAFSGLPYKAARWIDAENSDDLDSFVQAQSQYVCNDQHGNPTVLLENEWRLKYLNERFPKIRYHATAENFQMKED